MKGKGWMKCGNIFINSTMIYSQVLLCILIVAGDGGLGTIRPILLWEAIF